MPGMGGKKEKSPAVKSDIKYIKCQVCEEITKNLHREVKKMRDDLPPKKKLAEFDVIEKVEKMCDPETTAGEWITYLDMAERDDRVKLETHEKPSKCKSECRTIAKACEQIMDDHDTDLAEVVWKGDIQRAKLNELLCRELSGVCDKKDPKVKKGRKAIEDFEEMSDQEIEMEKLMKSMKDIPGMPGMSMHSREDMMEQMANGYGGDYGGYGDDYGDYAGGDMGMGDIEGMGDGYGQDYGEDLSASEGAEVEGVAKAQKVVTEGLDVVKDAVSSSVESLKDLASGAFSGLFGSKQDAKEKGSEL